jgi:hypothetical protein
MLVEATAARHLEAAGATSVTFEFRGTPVTIPLAIEAWPLGVIRAGRPATAVRILLGAQCPPVRTRGDVIELSHRMADACGVTPQPEQDAKPDAVLGAVPQLLSIVDNHGDDLEADLLRFYSVDYRLPPPAGPTLRQVWTYIRRLPRESALLAARNGGEPPWSREAILQARTWEMWTQKRYFGRPLTREEVAEVEAARAAAKQRLEAPGWPRGLLQQRPEHAGLRGRPWPPPLARRRSSRAARQAARSQPRGRMPAEPHERMQHMDDDQNNPTRVRLRRIWLGVSTTRSPCSGATSSGPCPSDRNTWDMNVQFEFEDGRRVRAICTLLGGGPDGMTKVRNAGIRRRQDRRRTRGVHAARV